MPNVAIETRTCKQFVNLAQTLSPCFVRYACNVNTLNE
jgi:hypothetical protein